MKNFHITLTLAAIIVVYTNGYSQTDDDKSVATATLETLKNLAGDWEGTFEWTGEITGKGVQKANYYLTGRNSTVVENLINEDGTISMTSTYHLDGKDLRMTHYCAAGNQPRLKATNFGSNNQSVEFEMVDITNLRHEKAGHVYGVMLEFPDDNSININFKYINDDKESVEAIKLTRVGQESSY